jgi:predicted nuclease with TOPRIM domain
MLADRLATRMVGTLANHLLTANVQRFTELARSGDLAEELEEMCNRLEAKNQDGEGGLERLAARFEEGLGRLEALENRLAQRLEGHEAADSSDTGE